MRLDSTCLYDVTTTPVDYSLRGSVQEPRDESAGTQMKRSLGGGSQAISGSCGGSQPSYRAGNDRGIEPVSRPGHNVGLLDEEVSPVGEVAAA